MTEIKTSKAIQHPASIKYRYSKHNPSTQAVVVHCIKSQRVIERDQISEVRETTKRMIGIGLTKGNIHIIDNRRVQLIEAGKIDFIFSEFKFD